jgi:hypothetical protein
VRRVAPTYVCDRCSSHGEPQHRGERELAPAGWSNVEVAASWFPQRTKRLHLCEVCSDALSKWFDEYGGGGTGSGGDWLAANDDDTDLAAGSSLHPGPTDD